MKKLKLVCLTVLLIVFSSGVLSSCSVVAQTPPKQAVRLAINQTLLHTQQALAKDLGLSKEVQGSPNFKVDHINIASREQLSGEAIADSLRLERPFSEIYRVRGSFSATINGNKRSDFSPDSPDKTPFEIYLATYQEESDDAANTWFLLPPL